MLRVRSSLTFSNVTAMLALFVALGGGAYAATALPRNSVGSKQLKRNAVTSSKIRKNAVRSRQVRNNSLTGSDIRESRLGTVPRARALARVVYKTAPGVAPAHDVGTATANCDAGQHVLGGGAQVANTTVSFLIDDFPAAGGAGWTARVFSDSSGNSAFTVYAVCAPVRTTG
jgi:hypothetical protein